MNELSTIQDYNQFKEALGTELQNQAEGFVRTGYLLKRARDTDILKDSGYATVAEFARAEYGLSKDIVSRYIAINDRYSIDGYSEYLMEQYEGYGVAKLQEMLTLPDSVVELMSPEMTRREIQDVKQEVREEKEISDLEVLLEGTAPDQEHMTTIQKVIHKYFYEQREEYLRLEDVIKAKLNLYAAVDKVMDVIAPSGMALKTVRVQGIGKIMISFKGKENDIEMLNVRTNEKGIIPWKDFIENMISTFGGKAGVQEWEMTYKEPFAEPEQSKEHEKTEVVPVQQQSDSKTTESVQKQEENVIKTAESVTKEPESVPITEESVQECEEEPQEVEENLQEHEDEAIEEDETIEEHDEVTPVEVSEPEIKEEQQELNKEMLGAARNSFSNLKVEMEAKAYKAALASARHLVHYLEAAGVEE